MIVSHITRRQLGPRCSVTRMADSFPPLSSEPSIPSEGHRRSLHNSANCSMLARKAIVSIYNLGDLGSSMAAIITSGFPVTKRRADLASKPKGPVLVGMAPAEPVPQQLDETVHGTLNNARAPSTRANYAI